MQGYYTIRTVLDYEMYFTFWRLCRGSWWFQNVPFLNIDQLKDSYYAISVEQFFAV